MVVDAFTDLVFTADNNHRHVTLAGLTNEEHDGTQPSTQPTNSNLLPPSPREIGPFSFLNSPRYLLVSPNASLEQQISSPLFRSSPDPAVFPLQSPLPPLTPLADIPTPQGWNMISPSGPFSPSFFLDTSKSLSQDQEKDKLLLAAPGTPKQEHPDQKETERRIKVSAEHSLLSQVNKPEETKSTENKGPVLSFSRDENVLRLRENPPDVRRRLFDEGTDEITPAAAASSDAQTHLTMNPNPVKPQRTVGKGPGLKSRIVPPPPISIPTNPFSKYKIQEIPKGQKLTLGRGFGLSHGTQTVSHPPHSHMDVRDGPPANRETHTQQAFDTARHLQAFAHSGKTSNQTDSEEKKPIMTSEASSVLAELNRQRSQVEAKKKNTPSVAIPKPLKVSGPNERTCCNCKASQCIKRYCSCFATSNFCGPQCGCRNCENTLNNSSCVGIARKALMDRDPNAFVPRIRSSQRQKARGRQTIRGCNCRKGCQKNYCICKENGLVCGVRCTCSGPNGCQNQDQSKLGDVHQVIENMPASKYNVPAADDVRRLDFYVGAQPTKVVAQDQHGIQMNAEKPALHTSPSYVPDPPMNPANPILAGYPALPTPTTPSMPYSPFFEQDRSDKKRSITFGELSDGFKRIKVGDPDDRALPELKQSSSKYERGNYSSAGLQTTGEAQRFLGTPVTSSFLSGDTPMEGARELMMRDSIATNGINGSDHLMGDEKKLEHIPRILRYKFGSGNSAGPFEFPR